jgi:glutamyl-tRNA synthetase
VGGAAGPYRQSERLPRYGEALERLRAGGRVYPCFCSRAEVAAASQAPHGPPDDGPRYPGTCARLPPDEVARRGALRAPAWRLRVAPGMVEFEDGVHGRCAFDVAGGTGDFVVARADGIPAYQLAVVVDDAAMGISDVVRGDDLLPSTARQLLLYRALDLSPPRFAHVPLVLGEDGARLAKRHGALSLGELRERGADPTAVVALLAELSGLGGGCGSPRELVRPFSLERVPRAAVVLEKSRVEALLPDRDR